MQTALADFIRNTPQGQEADKILRACVHCGFCNATCPTYQMLGDELDGPRGRIYLMKQMLEGQPPGRHTQLHLDRCLTCRNCEITCPSGVRYGALLDIGRELIEARVPRPLPDRWQRRLLRWVIPYRARFAPLLRIGRILRPLLPPPLKRMVPPSRSAAPWPQARHPRTMIVLEGCVQPAIAPGINAAAARVLDRLGISLIRADREGCCGALSHHLTASGEALDFARRNIDAWWPQVQAGAEAVVMTASGCGVHVKEYGHFLRNDPTYAEKAARISALTQDLCEVLAREDLSVLRNGMETDAQIAFHPPCTLQHGQGLHGVTERLLTQIGFKLTPVLDSHLCCGSAGTYSILQRELSQRLLKNKIDSLQSGKPDVIVTANIGCLTHLQSRAAVPVRHWVELLA